ncbi:MAG: hypothetical protein CMJ59_00850 [Planctomycetaceae bacterium]|nr:hypothetical protein [Planctomycetaceae bacterium]
MHRSVFFLAILMGTIFSAQVPEEIPLEPPANTPNVAPAIDADEVPEADAGPAATVDKPPADAIDAPAVAEPGELVAPTVVEPPTAEVVTPPVTAVEEQPSVDDTKQADALRLGSPARPAAESVPVPRYERSLADRVVPRNSDRWDRVRFNAEKRAARRRYRIAAMKLLNHSKIRPAVGATPSTSRYTTRRRWQRVDTSAYWETLAGTAEGSVDGQDQ